MEIDLTISTQKGTPIKAVTLALGEKYTYKNNASNVLVVEHLNASVSQGNAAIHIVTPAKAASYLAIEDPTYAIAPGIGIVFGALPAAAFGPVIEFQAMGSDVNAGLLRAYVLEVRSYG